MSPPKQAIGWDGDIEQRDSSARTNNAAEFLEEAFELDQIAQCESAGDAIKGRVGHREVENVGLGKRRLGASRGEHPVRKIEPDRAESLRLEFAAEVTGAACQISDERTGGEAKVAHCAAPPSNVHPEGHHSVDEVVARGDGVKHRTDGADFFVTLGKLFGVHLGHICSLRVGPDAVRIRGRGFPELLEWRAQPDVVVVVELELLVVDDELLLGALVLDVDPEGFLVVVVVELEFVDVSSLGAAVGGLGTPTSAVLDTLGCAAPAGPAANARRMLAVTWMIRHLVVEVGVMVSPQVMSSRSGDHPKVPALNTPAPLGVEYQVESA